MIKCWYHRQIISHSVDARVSLPDATRAHVRNCRACRVHHETESEIARQLSAAAGAGDREPSPFLHARIMSSIAGERSGAERPRLVRALPVALTAACVLIAVRLWIDHSRPPGGVDGAVTVAERAPTETSLTVKWPDELDLGELTVKLDEPLQKEMQLVVNDTKTAMDSLARNFVPDPVRSYFATQQETPEL
jgi:hypothetical protein